MSRFWAAGGSSSESASDDDSYTSSESSAAGPRQAENRWADLSDESGAFLSHCCARLSFCSHTPLNPCTHLYLFTHAESEDEVRVVKSAKERYLEAFSSHIAKIRSAVKARDFVAMQSEFDALSRAMLKGKKILAMGVPRPLVKLLCDLEDCVAAQLADKAAFKRLSASQGRALNRMKLTLKKHNKPYALVMKEYRKNPMLTEEEESNDEEESSSSSSEEEDEQDAAKVSDSDEESGSEEDSDDESEKESVSTAHKIPMTFAPVTGMTIHNFLSERNIVEFLVSDVRIGIL